ncbi:2-dehydropantoate 2-reductase PAN5 [Sugiyamaella lignohabitans]|uniref:2-dehydropantoate 2-reductase PAN5 n=1 Tax=Sugiyamaella lignohabitans TaxID=796027 RepID=A0A167CG35_9ASCO|nr:2-dehydropantoate 2-reductase PAN5 [Sugiyamaella lignohabitans]ANB11643.1 2-dehydropantoate 2-reductase PAN5 [Sugiyamaella lignohabitans]
MASSKIFILGAGSVGSLVATSIESTIPKCADVALVLKSKERLQHYIHHDSTLRLWRNIGSQMMIEKKIPAHAQYPKLGNSTDRPLPIENLIVTTKATQTESAIRAILPSITPNTRILLLQNGIGTYEKLCEKFWPEKSSRPYFLLGITSHGVRPADIPWTYKHVGNGDLKLTQVPDSVDPLQVLQLQSQSHTHTYTHSQSQKGESDLDYSHREYTTSVNGEPTASEESVKSDQIDFDVNLHKARRGQPTDSEESVKADYSGLQIHLEKIRKGSPTDSEEAVRAEYSDLDVNLQKARRGGPTDSEESVRADTVQDPLPYSKLSSRVNMDISTPRPTESEEAVKSEYSEAEIIVKKGNEVYYTESEEAVKADYSDPLHPHQRASSRIGSVQPNIEHTHEPTDSEASVKAEYSDPLHPHQKASAQAGSVQPCVDDTSAPTDSEASVKADYHDPLQPHQKASSKVGHQSSESSQPNIEHTSDPTDSEVSVKADYEDPLHEHQKASAKASGSVQPNVDHSQEVTDSEASVKADYSDPLHPHQKASAKASSSASPNVEHTSQPTDSEASVKAEYHDPLHPHQKASAKASSKVSGDSSDPSVKHTSQPTDSEESVKADYEDPLHTHQKASSRTGFVGPNVENTSDPTDSEESVKADYSDPLNPYQKASAKVGQVEPNVYDTTDPTLSEASVKADYAPPLVDSEHHLLTSQDLPAIFKALLSTKSLLNARVLPYSEFKVAQYEKLIVNAAINPLTAIFRCTNGQLLEMENSEKVLYDIVKESCSILKTHARATFAEDDLLLVNTQLNPHRMLRVVQDVCRSTANNKSSMLVDVERGNSTELPYINGYLIELGKQHRKRTDRNSMLAQLVQIQLAISRKSEKSYVPLSLDI